MKLNIISILAGSLFLIGCSFMQPLTEDVYDQYLVKSYDNSKAECYNATKDVLEEFEYEIDKESLEKGKIITERKDVKEQETKQSLSGEHKQTYDVNVGYKYYFTISALSDTSCEVRVDRFRAWYRGKEVYELNVSYMNEHQWMPIFKEIEEKLTYNF